MVVLKKFFFSLKKLFGQRLPAGRKKKRQQKTKRRVRKKLLSRRRVFRKSSKKSRAKRPAREKTPKKSRRFSPTIAGPAARLKSSPAKISPSGQSVGEITHFFAKIQVVVVKISKGNLVVGNKIRIHGPQAPSGRKATDFTQTVRSMQVESVDVRSARSGQLIGLKVERAARVGDKVYKLV